MDTNNVNFSAGKVSTELKTASEKAEKAGAYRTPRLHVAGTAVEMVQGSWGPVKDVGGYNCYDFR